MAFFGNKLYRSGNVGDFDIVHYIMQADPTPTQLDARISLTNPFAVLFGALLRD
ncbi:MAG: hypothetical protein SH820_00490 [Xanthomonadales bacterium]|nr:hypothetical protein [Xanthomonadales bacterium]